MAASARDSDVSSRLERSQGQASTLQWLDSRMFQGQAQGEWLGS